MNALIIGTVAFFLFSLGSICPHDFIYVPALLSVVVAGGHVGGTIFSLQSDGVYALHIRTSRATANAEDTRLGGIWAYGLVGVPAGAIALLIIARIAGIDDSGVATALAAKDGAAGYIRRLSVCLGIFSVTVIGGFLGLNLIRVISDRLKAEIRRQISGQVEPLRLLDRGKLQMEQRSYVEALDTFSALALQDHTLVPIVWKGRALKRLGRLSEAVGVLSEGLRTRGAADEKFRRAVVLWNLACYRTLMSGGNADAHSVDSVVELLSEAVQNAPSLREELAADNLDPDLVSLLGNPVFERWRGDVLKKEK
jgi:hypothetical protein